MPTITLRPAKPEDCEAIHGLICDLAIYEKEDPKTTVQATPDSLRSTLFPTATTPRYATCILAYHDAALAGMAIYFNSYSTWRGVPGVYLEDLFVKEEFRGKGVGKALLARLAREVKRIGGARLEWSVLRWNEPSIRFYESIGAKDMGVEWKVMRVDGEALGKLADTKLEKAELKEEL